MSTAPPTRPCSRRQAAALLLTLAAAWTTSLEQVNGQLSIGLNFVGGVHTVGPDASSLTPTDVAGVVGQANWNNLAPWSETMNRGGGNPPDADGMAFDMKDANGNVTALDVAWSGDNTYASLNPSIGSADEKLMDGYLDVSNVKKRSTVTLTDIPFNTYDLYVYVGSDGNNRTAFVDLNNDPATSTWFITSTGGGEFSGSSDYRRATAKAQLDAFPSNYVLYSKMQASTLEIGVNQGSFNAGIHGIQLVQSILPARIEVDATTGLVKIVGGDVISQAINGYEIRSTAGSLLPANHVSLGSQGIDIVDGTADSDAIAGNSAGERWETVNAEPSQLLEGFLFGSSAVDVNREVTLGRIYDTSFGEDSSLEFLYTLSSGVTVVGLVEFVFSPPGPLADFDQDQDVDGADFLRWQRGLGTASAQKSDGDADGNGAVDGVDLSIWRQELLSAGGAAAAIAAPEPGSALLAWCAAIATCSSQARKSLAIRPGRRRTIQRRRGAIGRLAAC
jgi:hypothetical protein